MSQCLLFGHAPREVGAAPDANRCRAANVPTLMPGQPVVICSRCGSELYVGSMDSYIAASQREQPEAMH